MLTEFPVDVAQNKDFWLSHGRFDTVLGIILELVYSEDNEMKALAYNAAISLMLLSKDLQRTDVCETLLPMLLNLINQHGENVGLVSKLKRLVDLVSLDDGNIFRGKHREVFWCMIRVAEKEDASDELRYEALNIIKELDAENVTAMESVIKNLSQEDMRRVVAVALNMMACIVDDPLWVDVDNDDCRSAGFTENFSLGQFLLNCLCLDGVDRVFIPTAIDMITTTYASNMLWPLRHSAMLAIASIVEKNFNGMGMIHYFEEVAILVLNSLNEPNHRVLWATMHAIKHLSDCKQLLMHTQYDKKLLEKLVPIAKCHSCPRVQSYAVIAIRLLVKTCGLDKIPPFGEPIVASLLVLLKHEKLKLHGDAIDALKSIAVSFPGIFRQNHYDTTMEALKVIVFNEDSSPILFLHAKCLECMVYLVRKVGPDNFEEEEAVQVVESLVSLDGQLSKTKYLIKCIVLKALEQICQCPRVSIDKFIDKIVPMLFGSAQPCLELTEDDKPYEDSLDDAENILVETMRVRACNTLSYCAVRSSINFSPHIGKVTTMFIRLLGCSSFEIRKASILGLSKILLSLKVGDKSNNTKRDTTLIIVQALVTFLKHKQKTDRDLSAIVLRILSSCIQNFSSFFTDESIKQIADGLNNTIDKIIKFEIEKAQEGGTSEDLFETLSPEEPTEDAVHLISTAIDTFGDQFMLHVDTLMSNVVVFLTEAVRLFDWIVRTDLLIEPKYDDSYLAVAADDKPDRVIAFAISIFNVIFPLFPDKFPPYHGKYSSISYLALRKNYPFAQLHATRAIGICAMFGGDQFKSSAPDCISILYNVINKALSASELCDTAVATLGKIYEFHCDHIDSPKVVRKWLNYLPLKYDFNEAIYAHGLLVKLIQRSDKYLFGSNNRNLPRIVSVVKEILSGPIRLGTEEAITEMIDFMEKHDGMEIGTEEASIGTEGAIEFQPSFAIKLARILELQPSLQIRTEVVTLLLITLPEGVVPVFSQYVCDCISGDAELDKKKGLLLLTELSVNVVQNREFWLNHGNFDLVFGNILELVYSMDQELKNLAYNASMSLMLLSKDLHKFK
ncbi:importin-5 [Trifolium repens]|nr:importin-5 [Trifolium repens]